MTLRDYFAAKAINEVGVVQQHQPKRDYGLRDSRRDAQSEGGGEMSDTPRTGAAYFKPHATMYDLALIECKLNVANERIKRLEEAIEGTIKWIVDLANSGDAGFWNPEEQSVIIAARAALNKEAKP